MQSTSILGFVAVPPEKKRTARGDVAVIVAIVPAELGGEPSNCYFRVICWGSLADSAMEAQNDDMIFARGRLVFDKETGGPRTQDSFEIIAEYIEIHKPIRQTEA